MKTKIGTENLELNLIYQSIRHEYCTYCADNF